MNKRIFTNALILALSLLLTMTREYTVLTPYEGTDLP